MKKCLYLSAILLSLHIGAKSQTVSTQYGLVTGHMNGAIYEFLGIPYAAPPVDTLRWKPTLPHENWTTPIIADSFPPVCPQKRYEQGDTTYTLEGEEDCLYLNIWSPDINANLPVMVFIHGGGNQQGSTSQLSGGTYFYDGKNLADRGDVVVVTIEYRLGVLGYLVHPGLELENSNSISGNYAVMDQIFALQWIQNNIAAFGGNPSNVTIFGESAGGLNVGNLLTSPLANGLFHKAIIQSAEPHINDYTDSEIKGIDFVNEYIQSGTDSAKIAFMRSVHADSITIKMSNPLAGGVVQMNWQPVVDGYVFNDFPENSFQKGAYNKVPLIIGSNSEEMSIAAPLTVFPTMVDLLINTSVPFSYQSQAHTLYPSGSNSTEARESYVGILTDAQFTSTTRRTAQCVSLNQTEPVWRYFFTHKHTITQLVTLGSYHGMELFYVFNNWENATLGSGPLFKPADDSTQNVMLSYWTNFARTGDPNGTGLTTWPQYNAANDCYLEIKATPNNTQCGLRTTKSDLWDDVVGFTGCTSSFGFEDLLMNSSFKIYPNPSKGLVNIDFPDNTNFVVSVYNLFGQKVCHMENSKQINLSKENCGIYFIEVKSKGETFKGKIVKND